MLPSDRKIETYLNSVARVCEEQAGTAVSVVLFGSAAIGGYSSAISDVDLLFVVRDGATRQDRDRLRETISELEASCGVAKHRSYRQSALDTFMDRITANTRTFFICTRSDLLSGR